MHLQIFRPLAAMVFEFSTVFPFSYRKNKITKFDLAIKKIKITSGSSFEQTIMGRSLRCYIQSFVEISTPVSVKNIFEWFSPYMGMLAILVM